MKNIILNNGMKTMVDDLDFEYLNSFKWKVKLNKNNTYAYRSKNGKCIWMHRQILGLSDINLFSDHKDHNGLNNQRDNLRVSTRRQNNCNKKSAKNSTSKYLGVSYDSHNKNWRATIFKDYKQTNIGRFKTEENAATAYNIFAEKYHGRFANHNN